MTRRPSGPAVAVDHFAGTEGARSSGTKGVWGSGRRTSASDASNTVSGAAP